MSKPEVIKMFIMYAHEDTNERNELRKHLRVQIENGIIDLWGDHEIKPGERIDQKIKERLETSDILILLLSADFFVSDYIQKIELPAALRRHKDNECHILPVIARECDWEDHPIGKIKALPPDGRPIVSSLWPSKDAPYRMVVEGIKATIKNIHSERDAIVKIRQEEEMRLEAKKKEKPAPLRKEDAKPEKLEITHTSADFGSLSGIDDQSVTVIKPRREFKLRMILGISICSLIILGIFFWFVKPNSVAILDQPKENNINSNKTDTPKDTSQAQISDVIKSNVNAVDSNSQTLPLSTKNKPTPVSRVLNAKSNGPPETISSKSGRYFVLIGAFTQLENARIEMQRFVKMGYLDAEVIKYQRDKWRVIAKRCNTRAEAEKIESDLERQGIDSMVVDGYKK